MRAGSSWTWALDFFRQRKWRAKHALPRQFEICQSQIWNSMVRQGGPYRLIPTPRSRSRDRPVGSALADRPGFEMLQRTTLKSEIRRFEIRCGQVLCGPGLSISFGKENGVQSTPYRANLKSANLKTEIQRSARADPTASFRRLRPGRVIDSRGLQGPFGRRSEPVR
jgi:hypothetical protein